ncbi:MAG: sulfatase family protein [Anaerolineae bacterium]
MGLPNILYIHSHDTGRYVQPYGHAVPTPALQRLAEQGVLFRQAFCVAPTCSPSRAGLLTGMYPHERGMLGLAHRGFQLRDYRQHLVQILRGTGYYTALVGVQHEAPDVAQIGYDRVVPLAARNAEGVAQAAAEWLAAAPARPFFLSAGFFETHREFLTAGPREDARYTLPPAVLPDTPRTRGDMAAFKASARALDEGIGRVLEALERHGLAENTLVLCTTDHGPAFPDMKCNLTDHGTGVMLILRGPGGFAGGRVCDALVSHIDLIPTLCELLGISEPARLAGRSLLPWVRGEVDEVREAAYSEVTYHAAYEPQRAARTRRWKYIRRFGARTTPVLPNCDDSPSKTLWLEHGWRDRPVDTEQLYDLVFDPGERHNLVADPAAGQALAEMRALLEGWMRETHDPLLDGPVPAPGGVRVNRPDDLSPQDPTVTLD